MTCIKKIIRICWVVGGGTQEKTAGLDQKKWQRINRKQEIPNPYSPHIQQLVEISLNQTVPLAV